MTATTSQTNAADGRRDVVLYELNEVPWQIVDLYLGERPGSKLGEVLARGQALTTIDDDPAYLQPWRTWPTFHTGLYAGEHNSFELGQDPETFNGETVWEAAENAGLSVGLFGVLQSWPARTPRNGGFWVPDTFARTAETYPPGLQRFQEFNLSMTAENAFSANASLNAKRLAGVGLDLLAKGLTPRSAAQLARQVARERRDERWKAARPMAQVLPAFDLYWRLHRRERPNLSIFFTNHVAGMMHRYWGDAVPGYSESYGYERDDVFAQFLFESLDLFDAQLRRIVRWVDDAPGRSLVVASSMGQAPVPYDEVRECYVLREADRLTSALGLGDNELGLTMYPRYALEFATHEEAQSASEALERVSIEGDPMFHSASVEGRTLSVAVAGYHGPGPALVASSDGDPSQQVGLADLGLSIEERLGGGNTAYHVPDGIWLAYGAGIPADSSRSEFSALDAKNRVLGLLGIGAAS